MKFIISLLVPMSLYASPIKIYYEMEPSRAEMVREIFLRTYNIPEGLITLKEVKICEGIIKRGKLDLCLKNNGDLKVVSADRRFITESLKIFQAP